MRRALLLLLLLAATAYGQNPDPSKEVATGEEFTVKIGEQVLVKDTNLTVRFLRVAEDSRCPVDVTCVWAGNARLEFELRVSKKKHALASLNTTLNPKETHFKKFRVRLLKLNPGRKQGVPANPADYEATLIVEKP